MTRELVNKLDQDGSYEKCYTVNTRHRGSNGKTVELSRFYYLQDHELLLAGRCFNKHASKWDFDELVDLRALSPVTCPRLDRKEPGFFRNRALAEFGGENFYYRGIGPWLPMEPVFTLYYPLGEADSFYRWDALSFGLQLKFRILSAGGQSL